MVKRVLVFLLGFGLGAGLVSCEKLGQEPLSSELLLEETSVLDSIPLEYGELIGVTAETESPFVAGLWFEKPDKTIVVVRVNYAKGVVNPYVLSIPRR